MGKSNQINMNSKVDENKYEDEDVVVVTSIITPTITTSNTTIRQQDHLRSLHIVSRWDANYTKRDILILISFHDGMLTIQKRDILILMMIMLISIKVYYSTRRIIPTGRAIRIIRGVAAY